jgi:hypothetical protein
MQCLGREKRVSSNEFAYAFAGIMHYESRCLDGPKYVLPFSGYLLADGVTGRVHDVDIVCVREDDRIRIENVLPRKKSKTRALVGEFIKLQIDFSVSTLLVQLYVDEHLVATAAVYIKKNIPKSYWKHCFICMDEGFVSELDHSDICSDNQIDHLDSRTDHILAPAYAHIECNHVYVLSKNMKDMYTRGIAIRRMN